MKWVTFHIQGAICLNRVAAYKQRTEKYHKGIGRVIYQERNGEAHGQPAGKNYFSSVVYKKVAKELDLPNWEKYKGHSMRRTFGTEAVRGGL